MTMTVDLQGRNALVTGAAGGLGLAIATVLSQAGATVAINDIDADRCAGAARDVPNALPLAGDVSSEESCAAMLAALKHRDMSVDILVNNAGIVEHAVPTVRQSLADWRRVIDVNLQGVFLMSRTFGEEMIRRRRGAIVNIASVVGLAPMPASNAYGVAKAGVVMMTKTMAAEWARLGVRVNAVAPGVVDAPMFDQLAKSGSGKADLFRRRIPMGRLGDPSEIASAVAFLASDLASYVTGTCLPVDGGWLAFAGLGDAARIDQPSGDGL